MSTFNWAIGAGGPLRAIPGAVGSTYTIPPWPGLNGPAGPYAINTRSNYPLQINSASGQPVLVIKHDGEAVWSGKPSEAADALVKNLTFRLEKTAGVTKAARRRYYYQACKNILDKAERMTHEEFIDFLRKHVYTREGQVIMDTLKDEQN